MADRKRVIIFGVTGMLGSAVADVLKSSYDLVLTVRDPGKAELLGQRSRGMAGHTVLKFNAAELYRDYLAKRAGPGDHLSQFLTQAGPIDYAINAIGITIPHTLEDPALTWFVNAALPHRLATELGPKLIHITTDCVFDGQTGFPYDERSPRTPVDLYGLSKSLGEPTSCLTIRTSIIGRELGGGSGLLEWFLRQAGKTITGFANHFWNGITTRQFGKICDAIMRQPERFPQTGLFHVFSTTVSKYDMLVAFREKYRLNCTIERDETKHLNRSLATVHDFNAKLHIPTFREMLTEL